MLGHVIGAEAGGVGRLHQAQPLLVEPAERLVAAVDVIEDAERHGGHWGRPPRAIVAYPW